MGQDCGMVGNAHAQPYAYTHCKCLSLNFCHQKLPSSYCVSWKVWIKTFQWEAEIDGLATLENPEVMEKSTNSSTKHCPGLLWAALSISTEDALGSLAVEFLAWCPAGRWRILTFTVKSSPAQLVMWTASAVHGERFASIRQDWYSF